MAGRCLGELVRKMGERVLTHIIPILQKGMSSDDAATRQASLQGSPQELSTWVRDWDTEMLDLSWCIYLYPIVCEPSM